MSSKKIKNFTLYPFMYFQAIISNNLAKFCVPTVKLEGAKTEVEGHRQVAIPTLWPDLTLGIKVLTYTSQKLGDFRF